MLDMNEASQLKQWFLIASTVFVAELADKTQLTAFAFATSSKLSKFQVWLAASTGLVLATGMAVALAAILSPFLAQYSINRAAGVLFIGIGIWMVLGK